MTIFKDLPIKDKFLINVFILLTLSMVAMYSDIFQSYKSGINS